MSAAPGLASANREAGAISATVRPAGSLPRSPIGRNASPPRSTERLPDVHTCNSVAASCLLPSASTRLRASCSLTAHSRRSASAIPRNSICCGHPRHPGGFSKRTDGSERTTASGSSSNGSHSRIPAILFPPAKVDAASLPMCRSARFRGSRPRSMTTTERRAPRR